MQQMDTGVITLLAGEDLEARRRVKFDGATQDSIVYADAGEPCIGVTQAAADSGDRVAVKLIANSQGTFEVEASGATSINAILYGSDDGKVAETVAGTPEFYSRYAASASGSIVECAAIPAAALVAAAGGAGRDFQNSVSNRLTAPTGTDAVGDRILVISAATGVFAGEEDSIAVLEEDATWTFYAPTEGAYLYVEDEDVLYSYSGAAWVTAIEFGGIAMAEAGNIAVGTATGTKIGTSASQKLSLWNATPVVQPGHIADAAAATAAALTDNTGGTANATLTAVTAAAAITDNSAGVDPADDTIAVVTNNAAITDNSGGADPGNDIIAMVTNLDTLTESSGGTVDNIVSPDVAAFTISIPVPDMALLTAADFVTELVMPTAGKIVSWGYVLGKVVSTGSKDATCNLEIETTNLTGGVLTLSSAICDTQGEYVPATAITAANTFAAGEKISIEVTNPTATFVEGSGSFQIHCVSTGVNDNFKEIADQIITQVAANTAITAAIAQLAAKVNVVTTAVTAITAAIAQLAAKQNTTSTAVASVMNNLADLAAQCNAEVVDRAATLATVNAILADLAEIGAQAAS